MRVNILVPVDVAAATIYDARKTIEAALDEIVTDDRDDWTCEARCLVTALQDAAGSATKGSASFPTPADIERERLAMIEPDVSAALDKIKKQLLAGEATTSFSGIAENVRQEIAKRLLASGWAVTFADDPRGEGTSVAVSPSESVS